MAPEVSKLGQRWWACAGKVTALYLEGPSEQLYLGNPFLIFT